MVSLLSRIPLTKLNEKELLVLIYATNISGWVGAHEFLLAIDKKEAEGRENESLTDDELINIFLNTGISEEMANSIFDEFNEYKKRFIKFKERGNNQNEIN